MRRKCTQFMAGILIGMALFSGGTAYAAEAPDPIRVSSYKGSTLTTGEVSGLIVSATNCTAVSSDPAVVSVASVYGRWTATAKGPGTATITVTALDGRTGSVTITVESSTPAAEKTETSHTANMEVRQEMIHLINETRRANGASELPVNDALMDAAQNISDRLYSWHHSPEESRAVADAGYPYGFGANLTVFIGTGDITQRAITNWINSPGHFQTMIDPGYDCIGVGVTVHEGITYCYMFVGRADSVNFYA